MSERSFQVRFGPAVARIVAAPECAGVLEVLERWLVAGRCGADDPARLVFALCGREAQRKGATRPLPGEGSSRAREEAVGDARSRVFSGAARLEDDRFTVWDERAWEASVPLASSEGVRRWTFFARDGRLLRAAKRVPTWLLRLAHHHYFSADEIRASTFVYRHLIPILQDELLRLGATFVHASAVHRLDGGGLLISGWGGSGKTGASAWLHLAGAERWGFLADDLAIVDLDGVLHLSPLALNVFPYNTRGFQTLHERVVAPMGFVERAHWSIRQTLLSSDATVRRVPPLAGPPERPSCPLALCVHLERSSVGAPELLRIEPVALARIAANVLTYELRQSLPSFALANALCLERSPLASPHELGAASERLLAEAVSRAPVFRLRVPEAFGPRELGEHLESLWDSRPTEVGVRAGAHATLRHESR